jgi:transcriptional regulator with PAS, ATPase and Fis domain
LIEGESGTGKELMAKAIHNSSPFRDKPYVAVNCGAIAKELVESELFGHIKGSFTGATETRKGHFVAANGGTLFLDEIKLLRTLETGDVTPVGASTSTKVRVRILAATNRNLVREVASGRFREDLYYRLAVMVLTIPPLRERQGDVTKIIDGLIEQLYKDSTIELGTEQKKLSPEGKSLLLKQTWPGNVRELRNTLLRALIWSSSNTITVEDVKSAIAQKSLQKETEVLNRSLGDGFSLPEVIREVATHYLDRARAQAKSKTEAATLVGAPSYQTFDSWEKRYGLTDK